MEDVLGCERSKVARIGTPLGRVALLGVVTMQFLTFLALFDVMDSLIRP